jgi:hypothetical protein
MSVNRPGPRTTLVLGAAVALAILGSLAHNVIEFGLAPVLTSRNGELPMVLLWLAGFAVWSRIPQARLPAAWFLLVLALLNLIGGAIITVIPFGFLPFEPEQTLTHYLSHVIYGVAQLPVLALLMQEIRVPATTPQKAQ